MDRTRRDLLRAGGAAITVGLAGCSSNSESESPTEQRSPTVTQTTTATTTVDPVEQVHSVEDLDGVIKELQWDSVELSFVPADESADYAASNVFTQYSTDSKDVLNVEIDLQQAIEQRHRVDAATIWGEDGEIVQEFIDNVDDPEWRKTILDQAEETWNTEYEDIVDWKQYTNRNLNFEKRAEDSGLTTFWYMFEKEKYGGVSSTNNQYKAHAFQGIEQKAGFDTFVWDFTIPSHGLAGAIETPKRNENETEQQETYIIETDPTQSSEKDIALMKHSEYNNDEPLNGENNQNSAESFYRLTATEGRDLYHKVHTSREVENNFVEHFQNPETGPAYNHIDPMNAAAYIAEENIVNGELEGQIDLGTDTITINKA